METEDRGPGGVTEGREGMYPPCPAWTNKYLGCAQHTQKRWQKLSSALYQKVNSWRRQLLSCLKGRRAQQLPLGLQNSRDKRNHSLDYSTKIRFGNSSRWEKRVHACRFDGNQDFTWQFGCNWEHNGIQKRGLKPGIHLLAPPIASQEQGCSSLLNTWNSGLSLQQIAKR